MSKLFQSIILKKHFLLVAATLCVPATRVTGFVCEHVTALNASGSRSMGRRDRAIQG